MLFMAGSALLLLPLRALEEARGEAAQWGIPPLGGTLAAAICLQCWGWCWLGASNRRMEQDGAWLLAGKHREHGESQPLICFLAALSASSHRRIVTCPCPPALNSPPGPAPPAFVSPLLVLGCGAPALPPSLASLPIFPSAPAAGTLGFPAQLPFPFPTSSPASLPFSTVANPALLRALPPSLPCSPSPLFPIKLRNHHCILDGLAWAHKTGTEPPP